MWLIVAITAFCVIGIGSSIWLGPDNPVEEVAEEVIEDMIEIEIHLPDQPPLRGYIDLSPSTPEKKKPDYINRD